MGRVGGSIQVLATARADWIPLPPGQQNEEERLAETAIKPIVKEKKPEKDLKAEQADWIKRYLAQQQEVRLIRTNTSHFFTAFAAYFGTLLDCTEW